MTVQISRRPPGRPLAWSIRCVSSAKPAARFRYSNITAITFRAITSLTAITGWATSAKRLSGELLDSEAHEAFGEASASTSPLLPGM